MVWKVIELPTREFKRKSIPSFVEGVIPFFVEWCSSIAEVRPVELLLVRTN